MSANKSEITQVRLAVETVRAIEHAVLGDPKQIVGATGDLATISSLPVELTARLRSAAHCSSHHEHRDQRGTTANTFFDTCIASSTAPLTAQIEKLTKENDRLTALVSEQYQIQVKSERRYPPSTSACSCKKSNDPDAGALTDDQVVATLAAVGLKPEEMAQLIGNAVLIAGVDAGIDKALARKLGRTAKP